MGNYYTPPIENPPMLSVSEEVCIKIINSSYVYEKENNNFNGRRGVVKEVLMGGYLLVVKIDEKEATFWNGNLTVPYTVHQ